MSATKPFQLIADVPAGADDPWTAVRALRTECDRLQRGNNLLARHNIQMLKVLSTLTLQHGGSFQVRGIEDVPTHCGIRIDDSKTEVGISTVTFVKCACGADHSVNANHPY